MSAIARNRMKYWEIIAGNLSKAPVGVGAASQRLIPTGRPIWIADTHRGGAKRFVVHAGEKLTASLELNLHAPFFDAASRARNHDKLRLIKLLARSLCQQLVNFFEEAREVERLGVVFVKSGLDRFLTIAIHAMDAQSQRRGSRRGGKRFQLLKRLQPVFHRRADIQNKNIEGFLVSFYEAFPSIADGGDFVPVPRESGANNIAAHKRSEKWFASGFPTPASG